MTRTSSISGTFVKRQRSPVRVAAENIFNAAFFEPLIGTSPRSGTPPSMRKSSRVTGYGVYSEWNARASATTTAHPRRDGASVRRVGEAAPAPGGDHEHGHERPGTQECRL